MQSSLFYLGLLLLVAACFLYMRYNVKQINNKVNGLVELTTALTSELESMQRVVVGNSANSTGVTKSVNLRNLFDMKNPPLNINENGDIINNKFHNDDDDEDDDGDEDDDESDVDDDDEDDHDDEVEADHANEANHENKADHENKTEHDDDEDDEDDYDDEADYDDNEYEKDDGEENIDENDDVIVRDEMTNDNVGKIAQADVTSLKNIEDLIIVGDKHESGFDDEILQFNMSSKECNIMELEIVKSESSPFDKLTVAELKTLVKEKDPNIKITNLKKNDLLDILKNNEPN